MSTMQQARIGGELVIYSAGAVMGLEFLEVVMSEQDPKEQVLAVYPNAHARARPSGMIDIIDSRRPDTAMSIGCGSTDAAAWAHAARRTGIDAADEAEHSAATGSLPCTIPPAGWSCSRGAGHDGPCAALLISIPDSVVRTVGEVSYNGIAYVPERQLHEANTRIAELEAQLVNERMAFQCAVRELESAYKEKSNHGGK
ncbi:MAG: hypothetical protein M3O02_11125 [Acidobacteriota bacterium]|nr:hypothetical protein [Acidobacteriota bacterium]